MTRLKVWLKRLAIAGLLLSITTGLAVFFVLRSNWLREQVRLRIITETEKATGGTVELGRFDFDPNTLRFEVRNFVLRGREPRNEAPLAAIDHIVVGVTVESLVARKAHLQSLKVEGPRVRIVTYPDGTTNIPGPKVRREGKSPFERFVDLAIREVTVERGTVDYDNRRLPVDLRANNLIVQLAWDREGPRYVGKVSTRPFHFNWPKIAPLDFSSAEVDLAMERQGLKFSKVVVTRGKSVIRATGEMQDYRSPRFDMDVSGDFAMAEWVKETKLPISPEGTASAKARFTFAHGVYDLTGTLSSRRLAVRQGTWTVAPIDATTRFHLVPDLVTFTGLEARALRGTYRGSGEIRNWRNYNVKGVLTGAALEDLWHVEAGRRAMAWSATVAGPVEVAGSFTSASEVIVKAAVALTPAEGKLPIEGVVRVEYDRLRNAISFENSLLKTPRTRMDFKGVMGGQVAVELESTNVNDALPALALFSDNPPASLPLQLESGGRLLFHGTASSILTAPRVRGHADVTKATLEKRVVDHVTADVEADATHLSLTSLNATQGAARISGNVQLGLSNWRATGSSPLTSDIAIRQTPVEQLLPASDKMPAVKGILTGNVQVKGTLDQADVGGQITLANALIADEPFSRITGQVQYQPDLITVTNGVADHRAGRIPFTVRYQPNREDLNNGKLTLEASANGLALGAIEAIRQERQDLDARVTAKASGTATVSNGTPLLDTLNAEVSINKVTVGKRVLGNLQLSARTASGRIGVDASGDFLGSDIIGNGEWQLSGDAVGLGTLELGTLTLTRLNDLLHAFGSEREVPLDGQFQGEIVVSGALRRPNTLRARVNLSQVQLYPKRETAAAISPALLEELKLTNNGPIVAQFDAKGLQILEANLTGKDTNLAIDGTLSLNVRNAWNLSLRGGLNLGIFANYVPGLKTSGSAEVNALVRGTLESPLLGGRMEIKDATVAHRDLPNTFDKANGLVVFDRNRALLQNLTAQTGGGELKLNGFLSFGGVEQTTYRLNGQLDKVRIRYPEGASTTVNANLSLTGTSDQSLLAGVVTILRSGFTTRTDFGSVLFDNKPVQTPIASPLLRGMQFDVRLVNAPNLQLETSLTQGVQTTVDLRLRGSPLKPVILGTVAVTQGELNFFGTTYTITRGTVSFFNAARIEPVMDLDLETEVRAITVNMNISGSVDKPNITYRSDPPLQPSDIIALLAVGRTPTNNATVAPQTNIGGSTNGLFAGTDTLLGQALSAGVSGRLQRFFGVSRVKIDPQLLGLETTPQARLTIEQQISRDITLTYVTNLTGTLQQLVRLQWDFKKNWSVTVIRDENGVVGADVQFRTRLK